MIRTESPRVVCVDASVVINLIHVTRLDLLGSLGNYRFVVPEQVVAEVSLPAQAQSLGQALEAGHLELEVSTDPVEMEMYADLRQVMGRGEAACLAMAITRGCMVASDERGCFLRLTREHLGEHRVLNTPGLLLLAIRHGVISCSEADRMKGILESHRFRMNFSSFAELL